MDSIRTNLKFRLAAFTLFAALGIVSILFFNTNNTTISNSKKEETKRKEREIAALTPKVRVPLEEAFPHKLPKNTALYTYMTSLGVPSLDIIEMVKASKPIKNLSYIKPGVRFNFNQDSEKNLTDVNFRFSALETVQLKKADGKWSAKSIKANVDIKVVSYIGYVESTLWESAIKAEMNPYLITLMAEIFGWVVDFNREVRSGDSWRITAEQKLVNEEPVGWGEVLAAEYINEDRKHSAFLFRHEGKDIGYFNLEGDSLRKMFLKSPLRFGRVTSRFNRRRFHPKLKRIRPHNGVDYGAPIGTPVRSVADGIVKFAKRSGGGGNVLKIRHNSTYQTAYKHLSRYAKGVRRGTRVRQGQIVAYTGNTGLSTGPHLHYEFLKNGRFIDPLKQKFPSAKPLEAKFKTAFLNQATQLAKGFPKWSPTNYASNTLDKVENQWDPRSNSYTVKEQRYYMPLGKENSSL